MPITPENLYKHFRLSAGVCTDTRKIFPNCLFFALKGANFNGNQFALTALQQGAKAVIIDEEQTLPAEYAEQVLLVPDALEMLQKLAQRHRRALNIPLIAVCGSNGKTTTKELIAHVLTKKYKVFATQGNLNNHIGVPLSLLQMPQDTEMAVIEMGANHIGETKFLCELAEPDMGVITNNGLDHLEGFGSIEGVIKGNGELCDFFVRRGGKLFFNTTEPSLAPFKDRVRETFTYPQASDFCEVQKLDSPLYLKVGMQGKEVQTQLFGFYNFANVATALCIGKYLGVSDNEALEAVAQYLPTNNRSQVIQKGTNTVFLDAYNANPSSVEAALLNFKQIKNLYKVVILGDMLELGEAETREHERIGELLRDMRLTFKVLYGKAMRHALKYNQDAYYFPDKFSLHNWLQDRNFQNTFILIKGSRGTSLETVLNFIK
jgi:UDP-N-acetylmuramoyl-tripeptide--D-alanyl-D-alanine ligase